MIAILIMAVAVGTAATPDIPTIPPNPVPPIEQRGPDRWPPPKQDEPMPNLFSQPSRCGPVHGEVVNRIRTATGNRRGGVTYAVLRRVDGCMVPTPMGYHPDYLAPGAADPQSAKPAGERSRRR